MAAAVDSMQGLLVAAVQWLRLAIEAVGALWIAVGFAYALAHLTSAHLHGKTTTFTPVRLTFSRSSLGRCGSTRRKQQPREEPEIADRAEIRISPAASD